MKKPGEIHLVILGVMSLLLMLPLSSASAEDMPDTQLTEELFDLGSVKETLDAASPVSIVVEAWKALNENDLESVLALSDDCVARYGNRARQMQESLEEYPTGSEAVIRSYWALNEVATALFIRGKALQNAERYDEAKEAYEELVHNYDYGQCWDPKGWFWKPAEVAEENLAMIETGIFYDFGDYTSSALLTKAWEALEQEDVVLVEGYADKCIQLYGARAREMEAGLDQYPDGNDDKIFGYWALNDVATAHFIKAKAYMIEGRDSEAAAEFQAIRNEFPFAQCWDPRGWWWKPAVEADNWLKTIDAKTRNGGAS